MYQTHARIHLGNIQSNIEGIRRAVGPDRKILIAVKADAYGHGAVEVSKMAELLGVDWLGVATIPEALELRRAGISLPILKLSPAFPEEMEAAVRNSITLAVCDMEGVEALETCARQQGLEARVHLKVDTGMGRIGVEPRMAPQLALRLKEAAPWLELEGVFTHLPVSDSADGEWTEQQIGRFKDCVDSITAAIGHRPEIVHCSNSGAVLGHSAGWLDMVRPGVMIYGHYPDQGTPRSIPLAPGMSLVTRLSFVKKVAAGTSVGYGRTWIAPVDTVVGTIPIGYADGFNRLFSNRGRALVGGRSVPVAGRVCMDQTMLDLGPGAQDKVGDEVVLMGSQGGKTITCEEWASVLGTITYEVTCRIDKRVERIYDPVRDPA